MQLDTLFIIIGVAFLIRLAPSLSIKRWLLLASCILVLFWLQPGLPIRYLDFFLPLLVLLIGFFVWLSITPVEHQLTPINISTAVCITLVVIMLGSTRYFSMVGIITPSRPPAVYMILAPFAVSIFLAFYFRGRMQGKPATFSALLLFLLLLLLIQKSPFFGLQTSVFLRGMAGQTTLRASGLDLRWLGFSYIVFRMVHVIVDARNKRLKDVNLQEFFIYMFYYPAISAGPIDRMQRFLGDLRNQTPRKLNEDLYTGIRRILIGMFKKYALADTLSLISVSVTNVSQVSQPGWLWVMLYAYAFQILFDFSGYTDIAIGISCIIGIDLPENFRTPYLKHNLKLFWDNWHITLTQWFRTYFFNPVSRHIRKNAKNFPVWAMVLLMQLSTMILIGLWHGATTNFIIWGIWHGAGLFLQNRWSELLDSKMMDAKKPFLFHLNRLAGGILTFHFVAVGWLFFILPEPRQAFKALGVLFGII
ncbi:MAG: MBOAT family protein [Anaerolineae bacterium]|nr:MBOAT family protein [Anaerolineae bacterium]